MNKWRKQTEMEWNERKTPSLNKRQPQHRHRAIHIFMIVVAVVVIVAVGPN